MDTLNELTNAPGNADQVVETGERAVASPNMASLNRGYFPNKRHALRRHQADAATVLLGVQGLDLGTAAAESKKSTDNSF